MNWNNQPAVVASAIDSATTPAVVGCMTWTVTADVEAWVDGTANNGWRISDSVENDPNHSTQFRTRENGAVPGDQPGLNVNFTPP